MYFVWMKKLVLLLFLAIACRQQETPMQKFNRYTAIATSFVELARTESAKNTPAGYKHFMEDMDSSSYYDSMAQVAMGAKWQKLISDGVKAEKVKDSVDKRYNDSVMGK